MADHHSPAVTITTGVSGANERTSCENGTLQYLGPSLDMTIATLLTVSPDEVLQGEEAVALHVRRRLEMAANVCPGLSFVVTIGPTEL